MLRRVSVGSLRVLCDGTAFSKCLRRRKTGLDRDGGGMEQNRWRVRVGGLRVVTMCWCKVYAVMQGLVLRVIARVTQGAQVSRKAGAEFAQV